MTRFGSLASAAFGAALMLSSVAMARSTAVLDTGWRFAKSAGDAGQQRVIFDDSGWQRVKVPHTWNKVGGPQGRPYDTDIYSGPGWYRLHFKAPKAGTGKRHFLEFDGAGTVADVWLNGQHLGKHEGAFARFRFDATKAIRAGRDNVLAVKADNSIPKPGSTTEHVIPLSGDFFLHGGLYRKVSLVTTAPLHIDMMDFGGAGVYARTIAISGRSAEVEVRTRIANDAIRPQKLQMTARIFDAAGKLVATRTAPVKVAARKVGETTVRLVVATPHLWNGEADPYLYRVTVSLQQRGRGMLDEVSQPLGLRTMRFDAGKGFFLNGAHLPLHGVSLHQDKAGKGWAMSCEDQKQDFDIVQEMGANAVRLAHYQHDQCSYDETDRRGLVAWAEIPLVNEVSFDGKPASPALVANARQQLSELIRQNYNHPSIAMWSIGNEIDLLPTIHNAPSKAASLVRELAVQSHREDASRPSTFADCCEDSTSPERDVLVGYTDLIGYNRYFGWYYGKFGDLGPFLDKMHAAHPELPISVSEYGAGAALSQHSDAPWGGFINPHGRPQPEEYQALYHEQAWPQLSERNYLWGTFIWNMFDFAVKSREEGDTVDINTKGLVTGDRKTRKDAFYYFKANWSPTPTLHLLGRRHADRPYAVLDVKAYSNAATAELFVNGRALGATPCADGICLWKAVHLDPGGNVVKATASISGQFLSDSVQWTYSGKPDAVRIKTGDLTGYTTPDGLRFGSDVYFTGGEAKGINPPDTKEKDLVGVADANGRLLDRYREGDFAYAIPLPDGRYKVTLRFAEPSAAAGERRFDVRCNGSPVLRDVDVNADAGGILKAYARSFTAKSRDGMLNLEFRATKGKALLSALEVEPE
jgi:beta-galactosidase